MVKKKTEPVTSKRLKSRQLHSPTADSSLFTYRKSILPNGIRVVTEAIPHVKSVAIGVWIDIGSRDETEKNSGISHFIEHMVFKGTRGRSLREISRSIESVGGYLNAFTSKEHTCYYTRVLDEYSELALDVLSDLVQGATFPEKEIEKEKGVVIEELRNAEDDPDDIIHDYLEKALYGSHPLGFPVIGTEANLRAFSRHDLVAYRSRNYLPSRMVLAVAGNVQHEKFVEMVKKYFPLRRTGNGLTRSRKRPAVGNPNNLEIERPIQQAHVCLGTMAYNVKSPERYPLLLLNTMLGDGMSSRLFQNIRERYGFAYSVYSFVNMLSDTGSFGVYVGTDHTHVEQCTELVAKELNKLATKPVSKAELERTKAQLKGSMMLSLESIPNRMMRLGSSELYFNELSPLDTIVRQIDNVRVEDVLRVAGSLFRQERFSKIVFRPNNAMRNSPARRAARARTNK